MRDPYLYEDADVLRNLGNIRDPDLLRKAEADLTNIAMTSLYFHQFERFDTKTLQEIHRMIFGQIYPWAGQFRTIPIIKREDILGGDSVRYAFPDEIREQLDVTMKDLSGLIRTGENDEDIVFRLTRNVAAIWQTHPFREGNTRAVIVFSVLFAKRLGFDVRHELFRKHAAYVRNALVWSSQGKYSKYEYLEEIFRDALLGEKHPTDDLPPAADLKYQKIGEYELSGYTEQPHLPYDPEEEKKR